MRGEGSRRRENPEVDERTQAEVHGARAAIAAGRGGNSFTLSTRQGQGHRQFGMNHARLDRRWQAPICSFSLPSVQFSVVKVENL